MKSTVKQGDLMNKLNMKDRIFILDVSNLKYDLMTNINYIEDKISEIYYDGRELNFKDKNLLTKTILTEGIKKVIEDTNDQPVTCLLPSDINLDQSIMSYVGNIFKSMLSLYGDVFRFTGNIEIAVDVMLSGNNLLVSTYSKEL